MRQGVGYGGVSVSHHGKTSGDHKTNSDSDLSMIIGEGSTYKTCTGTHLLAAWEEGPTWEKCPSSPFPKFTQLSLSLIPLMLLNHHVSTGAQSECQCRSCMRTSAFPTAFFPTMAVRVSTVFQNVFYVGITIVLSTNVCILQTD